MTGGATNFPIKDGSCLGVSTQSLLVDPGGFKHLQIMGHGIGSILGLGFGYAVKERRMGFAGIRSLGPEEKIPNPARSQAAARFAEIGSSGRGQVNLRFPFVAGRAIQFVDKGRSIGKLIQQTKVSSLRAADGDATRQREGNKPFPASGAHNFLMRTLRKDTGSL